MFDPSGVPAEFQSRQDTLAARLEDAGLTCSQPPQQAIYDGWLLRYSPGKAKRAKSVNAIGAGQLPLDEKIAYVDAFYRAHRLPSLYRITPFSEPPALDRVLQDAGYIALDESRVMAAALPSESPARPARPLREVGASEFAGIAGSLRGSDAATIAAERQRIVGIALPVAFSRAGRRRTADSLRLRGDRRRSCGNLQHGDRRPSARPRPRECPRQRTAASGSNRRCTARLSAGRGGERGCAPRVCTVRFSGSLRVLVPRQAAR